MPETPDPAPPNTYTWPPAKVYTRADLRTGAWTLQSRLDCVQIVERLSPGVSEASLLHRAGTVLLSTDEDFQTDPPLDLLGHFVRIDFIDTTEPEVPEGGDEEEEEPAPLPPLKSFVFRIIGEQSAFGGKTGDVEQPVTQGFAAVGLEHELDQILVTGGFFAASETESADALKLATPVAFNEKGRIGLTTIGNRSANRQAATDLPDGAIERAAYAFDQDRRADGTLADTWSAADIIEYLLAFLVVDFDITSPLASYTPPPETPDPMAEALKSIVPIRLSAEGGSVKQVLDTLLRPEQGLAWRLAFPIDGADPTEESAVAIELAIFSRLDEAILLSDTTIPANADIVAVDAVTDRGVMSIDVSQTMNGGFGSVRVVGEPLLSCFTLAFEDGTLDVDWSNNDEFDYGVAGNPLYVPDPGISELIKDLDSLQHVYQRYALSREWDGLAGDGKGGEKTQVNPVLYSDGVLSDENAGLNRVSRGFEQLIPLETVIRPSDETAAAANAKTYRPAFLLVQYPGPGEDDPRRYAYIERGPPTGLGDVGILYLPTDRMSVQVRCTAPAVMANSPGWTLFGKMFGILDTVYCATECVATVALRTDQRLFVSRGTALASTNNRELTIEVRGAELWIIAPNTVTGVDPEGQLINYSGPQRVRDDTARLTDIATLAAAWYGRQRQAATIRFAGCRADLSIGQFLGAVYKPAAAAVNFPLAEIEYDFVSRTTRVSAASANLDFSRVGR
ncbi:MAG: hypothetical protein QM754_12015 [Tepidisphaeraceae bacterium]